jgi:uncharacterized membrane protein YhfC
MVSNMVIGSMIGFVIFSVLLFPAFILFFRKSVGISVKPLIIGSIGFIVFTQVLEKILHFVVISNFPNYAGHPWIFGIYGGMAAGVFEELGRFILFTWLLKKFHDYKGGISFGIGWGGIEAVVIALTVNVPNIIFALMINSGTFDATMGAQLPADQITVVKDLLLNQGASAFLWGIPERFFAVLLQIALSLFVLLAVVKKKFSYVIYAILIHALIDFPAVFYQTGYMKSLWMIELWIAIVGIVSFIFIKKARQSFQ